MDNKSCYFIGQAILNLAKPKWRAKAEIIVYTPDGVYNTTVIIRSVDFSLNNILYQVDLPKSWKFTQLRKGTRKKFALPTKIKFNDNTEISGETYDISIGGFSMISDVELSTIQMRFPCNSSMQFPKESVINFPDGILNTSAKFVRQKNILNEYGQISDKILCFRFQNLTPDEEMILRKLLMEIE